LVFSDRTILIAEEVARRLKPLGRWVVTVESCTGGGIAYLLTSIAGSSEWFDRSHVTYGNAAKQEMVGVDRRLIAEYGAVSEEVAAAMACGGLTNSEADYSLSVTGVAGPGGGSEEKPVGMVCFGWATSDENTRSETRYFDGDRHGVRIQTIEHALASLIKHYL